MMHNKHIAIVSAYSLNNTGLKYLLSEFFSAVYIDIFRDVKSLMEHTPEKFDFYFLNAESYVLYSDFFLPRKNKVILLTTIKDNISAGTNTANRIDICADTNQIIEQLQSLFETACHQTSSDSHEPLTPREKEVLQLIAQGYINKEIADKLNISFNTVLSHRKNITSKLGIKTLSGLSFYAMMNGYITPSDIEQI
ncbi:response regulator transcription factor [Coprobacter tertius]|uniref:response regulator transcription factor n=1 Tax=Coprobacter tertius TaxID=2944915 RepID=UPI0025B7294A|nr:response regulator transcription factor [Coprobacter tertius]